MLILACGISLPVQAAFPLPMPMKRTNAVLARVMVAWEPSPDSNVASYCLYWGTNGSRAYNATTNVPSTNVVVRLPVGMTNWIAATARDAWGLESNFSDELAYVPVVRRVTNVVISLEVRLLTGTNLNAREVQQVFTVFFTNPPALQRWWRTELKISKTHY